MGLEDHTPDNIDDIIDYAVRHNTDFHQFMLYTALPGTPLHAELDRKGSLLSEVECPTPDTHGQFKFNYRHPHITGGAETEFLLRAFRRDFEVNGPSMVRAVRTVLAGWKRYGKHPNPRIRRRVAFDARSLATVWPAAVAAARRHYRADATMRASLRGLLGELHRAFGWRSRVSAAFGGVYLARKLRAEARRLADGWTYEPPTFYERNDAAQSLAEAEARAPATTCRYAVPPPPGEDPAPSGAELEAVAAGKLQEAIDS